MSDHEMSREERLSHEKILLRYSTALENGDFDSIAQILSAAESDPELIEMIGQINTEYEYEQQAALAASRQSNKVSDGPKRRPVLAGLLAAIIGMLLLVLIGPLFLMQGITLSRGQVAALGPTPTPIFAAQPTYPPLGTPTPMVALLAGTELPLALPSTTATMMPTGTPAGTQPLGNDQGSQVAPVAPMIVKNGDMEIAVQDTQKAIDQVTQIAADGGGYVVTSQSWSENGLASASMTIAVRAENFDTAMRRLRDIAVEVIRESASGQDVSTEYVDLQSRLRNLEATRARIQNFLDQAATVQEALEINRQLAEIEAQIEQVKGRMQYLSGRAAYSTINVTIDPYIEVTPSPTPTPTLTPTATPRWSLGPRIDSAVETQTSVARGLLESLVWFVIVPGPYLIGLLVLGLVVRMFIRRNP